MKARDKLLMLLAAGGLLYAVTRRESAELDEEEPAAPEPGPAVGESVTEPESEPEPEPAPLGLALTEFGFALESWDRWMAFGPAGFDAALQEGCEDPEELVNEAFRKLYPEVEWPPQWGEPRYVVWQRIVQAVASSTDRGHRQGLRVVDHVG